MSLGAPKALRKFADIMGLPSVLFWVVVLGIGTYAEFSLPQWEDVRADPRGCYFTDALLIYVECRDVPAGGAKSFLFTFSWMLTWGGLLTVMVFYLTFPLILLAGLTLWCAGRYLQRLILQKRPPEKG